MAQTRSPVKQNTQTSTSLCINSSNFNKLQPCEFELHVYSDSQSIVPYQGKHQFLVVKVVINVFPQLRWFTHYSCVEGPVQAFHS